jgi:hypothetical protein
LEEAIYWKEIGNFPRVSGLRDALIEADSVKRQALDFVPEANCRLDGVLNCGMCVIRVG